MFAQHTYIQPCKKITRHKVLFYAVDLLTTRRNNACCVERNYVRRVYDHFMILNESKEKSEAEKIDINYIRYWERLHDSCVGNRRVEDLVVCYLSGPEPQNDFQELIDLGILPQNIWAFEVDNGTYIKALASYDSGNFPQPKIIKMPIEQFFKQTPKKFDIVYIDACGAIPSSQHALRCVATVCKFHRLISPGIIITNFAGPNVKNVREMTPYQEMISKYMLFKQFPTEEIFLNNGKIDSKHLSELYKDVTENFLEYYGDFISSILRDISSTLIPVQRFANSTFLNIISPDIIGTLRKKKVDLDDINQIRNNTLCKYTMLAKYIEDHPSVQVGSVNKINDLINECKGLEGFPIDLYKCFQILVQLKNNKEVLNLDIKEIEKNFNKGHGMYQFLDKPNNNLFFDLVMNQIAYPLHYNSEAIRRYHYKAKETEMFTDVLVLDEARYIYEWLPTVHQVESAFSNLSWQYVFRFALDGLIKNRIDYNNEYFFQGSVISKDLDGFKRKIIQDRQKII